MCIRDRGKKAIRLLNSLLSSNKMKLQTKLTIYTTIVDPILTYGCECWLLSDKEKKMIEAVEMNFLRRACNISIMQYVRNEGIRMKTGRIFTTAERIKSRQLLRYGHVTRMEEKRWPKKALTCTPQNRRRTGRLTTQWLSLIHI